MRSLQLSATRKMFFSYPAPKNTAVGRLSTLSVYVEQLLLLSAINYISIHTKCLVKNAKEQSAWTHYQISSTRIVHYAHNNPHEIRIVILYIHITVCKLVFVLRYIFKPSDAYKNHTFFSSYLNGKHNKIKLELPKMRSKCQKICGA